MSVCIRNAARLAGAAVLLFFVTGRPAWAGMQITSTTDRVMCDVANIAVAGTNTSDIVGNMWVSNATIGGAAVSFTRSGSSFVTPAIGLQLGKNYVTVYGSGSTGVVVSMINIWRYNIDGGGQQAGSKFGRRVAGTIIVWDAYGNLSTNCPPGRDIVAISGGSGHCLALSSDGTLLGWGNDEYGQSTCPSGSNYVGVVAGPQISRALRNDGSLLAWGGGSTNCPSGNDFVAIANGSSPEFGMIVALKSCGTIVCWGYNVPPPSIAAQSNFVSVAVGGRHTIGLCSDGRVTAWGDNSAGQTNCPSGNDFISVAAGFLHSIALRSDGSLIGWGNNDYGQTNCPSGNDFIAVAAYGLHSAALRENGTVVGWGDSEAWQVKSPQESGFYSVGAYGAGFLGIRFNPILSITNKPLQVGYNISVVGISGTNSPMQDATNVIVGRMWWSNSLNRAHGSLAASQDWTIANIALGFGTNVITVYGTNVYGWLGYDSVNCA